MIPAAGLLVSLSLLVGPGSATPDAALRAAVERVFEGVPATFVVREVGTGVALIVDMNRAADRFAPCSTFKIPNALIGIDAGAIDPQASKLRWDPSRDPRQDWWPAAWAGDHDLRSAMRASVVWYFQEIARRIGTEQMKERLVEIGYGNADISGGIDTFWLSSTLRISAEEQVEFLMRMLQGETGFSEKARRMVADAIFLDRAEGSLLAGKTGACRSDGDKFVGWLVGWAESRRRTWVYAMNMDGRSYADVSGARLRLVKEALAVLGVFPRR